MVLHQSPQLHSGINVTEIAHLLKVHRATLFRAFQQVQDETPITYLRRARTLRAKKLLQDTDFTLQQIAHSAGFHNEKYFFKTFRQVEGVRPTEWRKLNRID